MRKKILMVHRMNFILGFSCICACICIWMPLVWFLYSFGYVEEPDHQADYGSFTMDPTASFDGKLNAECTPERWNGNNELTRRIRVDIKNAETKKTVYSFSPARVWDFWGICWESDSYDLWIQSGDTGVHCYEYEDGEWVYDPDAVRPEDIVSKYDKK